MRRITLVLSLVVLSIAFPPNFFADSPKLRRFCLSGDDSPDAQALAACAYLISQHALRLPCHSLASDLLPRACYASGKERTGNHAQGLYSVSLHRA